MWVWVKMSSIGGWRDGSAVKTALLKVLSSNPTTTWWLTTTRNEIWRPLLVHLKTATVYLFIIINKKKFFLQKGRLRTIALTCWLYQGSTKENYRPRTELTWERLHGLHAAELQEWTTQAYWNPDTAATSSGRQTRNWRIFPQKSSHYSGPTFSLLPPCSSLTERGCLFCAIHFCRSTWAQIEHARAPICPLSSPCSLALASVTLMASHAALSTMASRFLEERLRMTQLSKLSVAHREHFQLLLRTRDLKLMIGSMSLVILFPYPILSIRTLPLSPPHTQVLILLGSCQAGFILTHPFDRCQVHFLDLFLEILGFTRGWRAAMMLHRRWQPPGRLHRGRK